jgi:hypothetical protein
VVFNRETLIAPACYLVLVDLNFLGDSRDSIFVSMYLSQLNGIFFNLSRFKCILSKLV